MSYIYDIVLNFNKLCYEVYEWRETDNILNFKRIPLFKISDVDYLALKYDNIVIDSDFVVYIKDCSYLVGSNDKIIAFLISNGKEVTGIRLDKNGNIIGRSSLIFDEEEDVLEDVIATNEYTIKYSLISRNLDNKISSRCISEKKDYLMCFFNSNNNIDIYRYIYYDFYEREEMNVDKIKNKLLSILNNEWNDECERLYNSIKLFNKVR